MSTNINEEIHLSDYLHIILNKKWLILFFLLITVLVAAVSTYTAKPVYMASSKLVVGSENQVSPISGQTISMESYYYEEKNFNTHFKLITSKPVLKMVAMEVDLTPDIPKEGLESLNPVIRYISRVKNNIQLIKKTIKSRIKEFLPPPPRQTDNKKINAEDKLYQRLKSRVSVAPVEDTRIMEISVLDTDPVRTRDIANAMAQKYIEFDLSTKLKSSTDKLSWMTDELYSIKKRLEDSEKEFIDFKQDQKMFSMQGRQNVINQKIATFNQKYLEVRNKKLELETQLDELKSAVDEGIDIMGQKSLLDDPIIKVLYSQMTQLDIEKGHLSKVYKAKHPKMVEVVSKIDNTEAKIKVEIEKKLAAMKRQRNILVSQEAEMKKQIDKFEAEAMKTSEKELEYNIHQRNVNTSQHLYDILLSQVKESNILKSSDTSNLTIVELADIPERPVKPNKKRNMLLSILLGLFGGVGLAFFIEYLDQTIRNEQDAENILGYPVLAIVPDAELSVGSKGAY